MNRSTQHEPSQQFRTRLVELLSAERAAIACAWQEALGEPSSHALLHQAERFLAFLAEGVAQPSADQRRISPTQDAALQQEFPAVYRVSALLALAGILADRFTARGENVSLAEITATAQEGLAAFLPTPTRPMFTERLARLNQLSIDLCRLQDRDAIVRLALSVSPELVGASSSALWLWDADQRAPVMLETLDGFREAPVLPSHLLQLFRQAGECAFSIDAGEGDVQWPALLSGGAVAFIPLPSEQGCRSILTVRADSGRNFTTDDILLLSALANLVSTALQNALLHDNHHQLVNLLQNSIGRLVQATSGPRLHHEDFIFSLLQVAEGLTRADAVGACLRVESVQGLVTGATSMRLSEPSVTRLAEAIFWLAANQPLPATGIVCELHEQFATETELGKLHYALAPIQPHNPAAGGLLLLNASPLNEEQLAFIRTIAGVIGVGITNMQQQHSNEVLLLQLNDLLEYFTDIITRQLAAHEDAAQQIMRTTAQKIARAAGMPIAICGWVEEEGTIRVWRDATVGIPEALEAQLVQRVTDHLKRLPLTVNNRLVRSALTTQRVQPFTLQPRQRRPVFPWLADIGAGCGVCIPMVVQSQAKGIVILADVREHPLNAREEALLSTYANQAALAMENLLLNEERRQKLAQTQQLYEYATAVSANLVVNNILQCAMEATCEILHAKAALTTLSARGSIQQHAALVAGFPQQIAPGITFPEDGIVGNVALRHTPITSVDLQGDGRDHTLRGLAINAGMASSLTVPMVAHGVLLGTLTVFSHEMREFTVEEEQLLQTIATQAAVAVQNAQMLINEKQRIRDLHLQVETVARQIPSGILDLALEFLVLARDEDLAHASFARMVARLACLRIVQQEFCEENPGLLNVKDAIDKIAGERARHMPAEGGIRPRVRVLGAALCLPWRQAMLLGLFAHEWLAEAELAAPPAGLTFDIMLQQAGEDALLQIDTNAAWHDHPPTFSPGLLELVQRTLHGDLQESSDTGVHRIRYRFIIAEG